MTNPLPERPKDVFAPHPDRCAVKIVPVGGKYKVYPLERVVCRGGYAYGWRTRGLQGCDYKWSRKSVEEFAPDAYPLKYNPELIKAVGYAPRVLDEWVIKKCPEKVK